MLIINKWASYRGGWPESFPLMWVFLLIYAASTAWGPSSYGLWSADFFVVNCKSSNSWHHRVTGLVYKCTIRLLHPLARQRTCWLNYAFRRSRSHPVRNVQLGRWSISDPIFFAVTYCTCQLRSTCWVNPKKSSIRTRIYTRRFLKTTTSNRIYISYSIMVPWKCVAFQLQKSSSALSPRMLWNPLKKCWNPIQYELLISIHALSELQGGNGKSRMVNLSIKKSWVRR